MEIQWSLVLFTALTGMGGCMFACVAADEFLGRAKAAAFPAAVAALVIAVVGGLASVTHLSHPDRIMGALSHPTSGIFTEALLVGCLCVCVVVYLVLVKREAAAGARKAVAVIGAVFGVLLSFMAGESYLMEARPNWCSQLLPLGYLLTAVSEGIAAYLVVVAAKAKGADVAPYGRALLVGGVLAAVGAAAYVLWAGPAGRMRRAARQEAREPDGHGRRLAGLRIRGRGVLPLHHVADHGPDREPVPERAVSVRLGEGMPFPSRLAMNSRFVFASPHLPPFLRRMRTASASSMATGRVRDAANENRYSALAHGLPVRAGRQWT